MTKKQIKALIKGEGSLPIIKQLKRSGYAKEIIPKGLNKATFIPSSKGLNIIEMYESIIEKISEVYGQEN